MILVSGRFIPAMALVTGAAQPKVRGTFMSFNSAIQHLALGLASMTSGLIIGQTAEGQLTRYWVCGLVATAATLVSIRLARKVRAVG
jgi:predicted MFS family arabinose efflux permease